MSGINWDDVVNELNGKPLMTMVNPKVNTNTSQGLLEQLFGKDSALAGVGDFMNSNTGKGINSVANIGMGMFDMWNKYQAYKDNRANNTLARQVAQYNLDRTKSENDRLDRIRHNASKMMSQGGVI